MLGINGKVVMPTGAPKSKIAATSDYSAEVVLHGNNFNDTIAKAREIIEQEGRIFIPPYDDEKVIAGRGLSVWKSLKICMTSITLSFQSAAAV